MTIPTLFPSLFIYFLSLYIVLYILFFIATLRVGSPYVFSGKNYEFSNRGKKNAITLKRLMVENWILELKLGTYKSFLVHILGAISLVIRVFEPKTETPIRGLNSSSSKTNRTRRLKVSNLEASGHAVSSPQKNMTIPTLSFFLYLFIYLLSKSHYGDKNSKITKARNLKFGQMISLNMKLCTCNFGGATSCGLGQLHPKLLIAKFITRL